MLLIWAAASLGVRTCGAQTLNVNFISPSTVGVSSSNYTATGVTVNATLGFAPSPGTSLTVVSNTGMAFITGTFNNLAQGQLVPLTYLGATYYFVANYFGGTGNDMVLQWADTEPFAWGFNADGELGDGTEANRATPVPVDTTGVLAGKTVVALSAGNFHSLALCSDGSVVAWGFDASGELGDGTTSGGPAPLAVTTSGVLAGKKRNRHLRRAIGQPGHLLRRHAGLPGATIPSESSAITASPTARYRCWWIGMGR